MSLRRRAPFLAVVATLAAASVGATSAGAALPGRNGLIAVVAGEPSPAHPSTRQSLVMLRQDGRVVRTVVGWPQGGLGVAWPAWSPDGRLLAYGVGLNAAEIRLGIMRSDGSHIRTLPRPAPFVDAVAPAWSRDGRRIAFGATGFDVGGVWAVDRNGHHVVRLTPFGQLPSWSSRNLLAVGNGGIGVWTMNADGSGRHRVAPSRADDPDWSPDGRKLAYTRFTHGREEVWAMRLSGAGKRRLARGSMPAWSPDGTRIAFIRGSRLFTAAAGGGDVRKVPYAPTTSGGKPVRLLMPAWQPVR